MRTTPSAVACGPSCAAAAPSASDVWSGWRLAPAARSPGTVRLDVKGADPHARDREFLLILCRDARLDHRRLTRRARGGQGRVVVIIDVGRHASTRRAAVRGAGLPPGALRIPLRRLGKRRRLAIAGTPRSIQLSFEPIDLRPQPLILAAQRISVTLKPRAPPAHATSGHALGSGGVSRIRCRTHADVMSIFPKSTSTECWIGSMPGQTEKRERRCPTANVQRARGLAERVVANEGWSPETARQQAIGQTAAVAIPVGTADGRELELLVEPAEDAQSRAFLRDFASFLRKAQSLRSYRDAERTQLPLRSLGGAHDPDGVFTSESMRQLVATAKQVASSDVPILLTGETGTGKEVLARLIHKHSGRAGQDFVPFNCTGVPKDLVESHLFGHRRGAFTGAREDSPGVIRAANGGTLLLDEVGEIELDVQPKLLRFLDKAEVHPLGEPRPTTVNVRVIAATNANLDELVRIGRFREDLLYRLNIITLDLPPLRTRREEILPLVHYFLQRIGRDVGRPNLHITEDAEKCLLCFEWPGNVRRLGNEMRRAVALAREDKIGLEHLSPEVIEAGRAIGETAQSAVAADAQAIPVNPDQSLSDAVAHLEQAMISRTLDRVGGHMGFAAQRLGISRKGLYLKRQRLGLDAV